MVLTLGINNEYVGDKLISYLFSLLTTYYHYHVLLIILLILSLAAVWIRFLHSTNFL